MRLYDYGGVTALIPESMSTTSVDSYALRLDSSTLESGDQQ